MEGVVLVGLEGVGVRSSNGMLLSSLLSATVDRRLSLVSIPRGLVGVVNEGVVLRGVWFVARFKDSG